ncbi:MAG: threonine-phosphate decarboxylase CobD [Candidatus Avoscillospira sp.]
MISIHGGDLVSAKEVYQGEILDLSVNLNPLGPPPEVRAAVAAASLTQYPDPACRALRRAIARRDGVDPAQVYCGNGAAEVIFRLALALRPRSALLTAPTFSEYEAALTQVGCACRFHPLYPAQNFDVTEIILEDIRPDVDLVMLCNPNNPTGRLISENLLLQILARCEEAGAVLAVDECFLPLAQAGSGLATYLKDHPKLFLLRAFTKAYAVPGLRLGYGLCAPELAAQLTAWGPCWNVSGPAQAAGLACCEKTGWAEQGRERIMALRPALLEGLEALGCQVIPGQANYLLFRLPGVPDLKDRLLRRGILIRSCANYRGLGPDWYRVAVGQKSENERLLTELRNSLEA